MFVRIVVVVIFCIDVYHYYRPLQKIEPLGVFWKTGAVKKRARPQSPSSWWMLRTIERKISSDGSTSVFNELYSLQMR